jgi:hypothetical protein
LGYGTVYSLKEQLPYMRNFELFILLALIFVYTNTIAKEKLDWYEGKIELNNEEVFEGRVSYNSTFDIVSVFLDEEEVIKSFSALQVKYFEYFDEEYEIVRKYESLTYQYSSLYKSRFFFEIVLEGGVILVRRPSNFNQFYSLSKESLDENFGGFQYFVYMNNKFINLKRFKKQILPELLKDHRKEISLLIEKYDLSLNNKENQMILIDYYNFLSDRKRKFETEYVISYN